MPELHEEGYVQRDAIRYTEDCVPDPCEVDVAGVQTVHKARKYGQQTAAIPGCLTAGSQLDLSLPDCTLPKPAT